MTTLFAPPSFSPPDSEKKPVYNLVIIYENLANGKRANHFCETMMRELGETTRWAKELWSFKVLDIPDVRIEAADAAAMADVVILALDGRANLPDGIKTWMEHWVGRVAAQEADRSPILVSLFGASDDQQEAVASTRTFLGALAETAGLTFLHTLRQAEAQDRHIA